MKTNDTKVKPARREFLGTIATGAAALGLAGVLSPFHLDAASTSLNEAPGVEGADEWFNQVKGKHKIVFDCTRPNDIFPFVWPRVFLLTNEATGTLSKDNSVVVILRHEAIPYAFEDRLWTKYNFGELFKAEDPATKKPSMRNPFWKPAKGAYKVPGFGEVSIGINELQDSGVLFCVCNAAMTVFSAAVAENMKVDAATVKKDWEAGLLPGIQMVPSGVWAVGRSQEHGCAYAFAG